MNLHSPHTLTSSTAPQTPPQTPPPVRSTTTAANETVSKVMVMVRFTGRGNLPNGAWDRHWQKPAMSAKGETTLDHRGLLKYQFCCNSRMKQAITATTPT